jgi:hypothetical protein
VDHIAQRWKDAELRAGARWLGFAVAAPPVVDRLDDAGLIGMLASGSLELGEGGAIALAWSAFFVALGIAASQIVRRHRPGARWWFFAGCAAPMLGYFALGGFRVSAAIGALGFVVAALRLRAAGAAGTLGRDGATPRYAGDPRDVDAPP